MREGYEPRDLGRLPAHDRRLPGCLPAALGAGILISTLIPGVCRSVVGALFILATSGLTQFYFDNSNFRSQIGQFLGTSALTGPAGQFLADHHSATPRSHAVTA